MSETGKKHRKLNNDFIESVRNGVPNWLLLNEGEIKWYKKNIIRWNIDDNTWYLKEDKTEYQELDNFVEDYRELFSRENIGVPGKQGTFGTVKKKLVRFQEEFGHTNEEILAGVKMFLSQLSNPKYCFKADNFIYKRLEYTKDSEISNLKIWVDEYLNSQDSGFYETVV